MRSVKGEITVFLSLSFTLLLSFIFGILESAVIQGSKNLSRIDTDRAIYSVFGEYHQELMEQYHLRCLLDGRKVPLVKSADKWVVSLSQLPLLLTDGGSVRGNDSGEGVGYSDYIRMFLFLKSVPEITMRTLDCVEEAFHSKHILFQADQCVTKLEIQNKIIVYKNLNYQYPVYFGYE